MSAAPRISAACCRQLPEELTDNGIVAVGYSMGGAMLLKYLGEEGSFSPLRAAATICAPIELAQHGRAHDAAAQLALSQLHPERHEEAEALAEGARAAGDERAIVRSARSVREYDDRFISPRYGFRGAGDYYDLCTPLNYMPEIRVPTMVLAACDDPWIPAEHYREVQMDRQSVAAAGDGRSGGHIGFHSADSNRAVVRHGIGEIPRAGLIDLGREPATVTRSGVLPTALSLVGRRPANRGQPPAATPHRPGATSQRAPGLSLADGTGDVLLAMLDHPVTPRPGAPLVILIHGLTGWEDSLYILSMTRLLLERGKRVLRLNLRGAGPSRATCGGHYYAGRSQDFRALLAVLPEELTRQGLMVVGYSLGGSMLLKYLGEEGAGTPVRAAATVCAPIDLAATCSNMLRPRNRLYHHYILKTMKARRRAKGLASPRPSAPPSWPRARSGNTTTSSSRRGMGSPARWTTTSAASHCGSWRAFASRPWCWPRPTIPGFHMSPIAAMIGRPTRRLCRC